MAAPNRSTLAGPILVREDGHVIGWLVLGLRRSDLQRIPIRIEVVAQEQVGNVLGRGHDRHPCVDRDSRAPLVCDVPFEHHILIAMA
jgi:hypothetical protein